MSIETDKTKRWFANGFQILWDDLKWPESQEDFAISVTEQTGVKITKGNMSCLLNRKGNDFPGDKKRQALASFLGMTADQVIDLGKESEVNPQHALTIVRHKELVAQFKDPEVGLRLNQHLIDIQNADPTNARLNEIADYVLNIRLNLVPTQERVADVIDFELRKNLREIEQLDRKAFEHLKKTISAVADQLRAENERQKESGNNTRH
jgi:hypothetical protein